MYTLSLIISLFFASEIYEMNINFGKTKSGTNWLVINDGVMGGLSDSKAVLLNNSILFDGNVSLENNGGFASLRSERSNIDLSKARSVTVRYRSENQKAGLRLIKSDMFYLPYLKVYLPETNWEWKTVNFSMTDFEEYRLERNTGKTLNDDDFEDIIRVGLIVSNKIEGPFKIEVDYIKFN